MPRLEKKFILSETIDLSNLTYEHQLTEAETHFSIPWRLIYFKSNDRFTFRLFCMYEKSDEWEIETKLVFKLKSANGTYLKLSNERNFGNSKENNGLTWAWSEFVKLEDIENHYAVNEKFEIKAQVIIKKMSGFGKEKLKYFDEHSRKHWDVILSVNDHKFYLLKEYLASQSTYFDKLLFGSFKESVQKEVELKEVDHEDFQSFLELIHGESAVNDTNIDGVLHLADMFDTPTAIRRCEEFLLEKSKWSLDERVKLAERYNLKDLLVKMPSLEKKFILSHNIDLSSVTHEQKYTKIETHFSIPWCMVYFESNNHLTFGVSCKYMKSNEWEIDTKLKFKLKSSKSATQTKCERTFGSTVTCWGWPRCIDMEDLKKYYAENGKFTIEAHLVIKKITGFGKEKLKSFDEHIQKHWDVILNVDGQKFHLLKAYLASQSPYFEKLLFGSFKEASQTEVELKEVDQEDFHSFLELIHGESAVDDTNIDGVLHLSDMFDAPTAIRRCEEFLLEKSKWSLEERVKLAERYHLKINLQQVPKEDQKGKLEDVVAGPAVQSPEATWLSWTRTVPVLFYLNFFLFVSVLVFAIIISLC